MQVRAEYRSPPFCRAHSARVLAWKQRVVCLRRLPPSPLLARSGRHGARV